MYDVVPKGVETMQGHAARLHQALRVARSPADVALDCRVIVTMLPSSPHVLDVYNNDRTGILSAFPIPRSASSASSGSSAAPSSSSYPLLIDSSTIDPATARSVSALAAAHSCAMVDAPVSGGVNGAEQGTLTFMVGGSASAFASCQPLLSRMGRNIVHCGESGAGQTAKVCNNLVLAVSMAAVAEACNLGIRLGMSAAKLAAIMNASTARCWASDTYHPVPGVMPAVPSSREYSGGFGSELMMKDLGLALQAADTAGVRLEMGESVLQLYQRVKERGWGGKDFSVVYELMRQEAEEAKATAHGADGQQAMTSSRPQHGL